MRYTGDNASTWKKLQYGKVIFIQRWPLLVPSFSWRPRAAAHTRHDAWLVYIVKQLMQTLRTQLSNIFIVFVQPKTPTNPSLKSVVLLVAKLAWWLDVKFTKVNLVGSIPAADTYCLLCGWDSRDYFCCNFLLFACVFMTKPKKYLWLRPGGFLFGHHPPIGGGPARQGG